MSPRLHRLVTSAVRSIMLPLASSSSNPTYDNWSKEALIARVKELEGICMKNTPVNENSSNALRTATSKPSREFDHSAHPRRKIALKFCYSGWDYNGLTFQNDKTPLPTVEETIFNALVKARLIDPELGPQGCEWERCGRIDSGVSAAGQVISLWVRSNLDRDDIASKYAFSGVQEGPREDHDAGATAENSVLNDLPLFVDNPEQTPALLPNSDKKLEEIRYVPVLNRLLPATIRIIAWSPVTPTFSARFACRYRHYKYFFSAESLDVQAMQEAAQRLVGEYDFRNFCKLDPSAAV